MEACLGEETIVGLAEGKLTPSSIPGLEGHLAQCAVCQDLLIAAMGAQTSDGTATHGTGTGPLARGTIVGRYTVLALVGRGGMGDVYAAYDEQLERKVALKVLRSDGRGISDAERARARLQREAKAMARLSTSDVVQVHDTGTFEGHVFVAMEFVDGVTLGQWLADAPRTREQILAVFARAGRGLQAAHAAGLVHRDFKPSNVMIGADGRVRVMDFGLAQSMGGPGDDAAEGEDVATPREGGLAQALTRTNGLVGTPLYMAPEQFRAGEADARTDQFGFCVALYQALYGGQPFDGSNLAILIENVLAGRVQAAPAGSTVPAWLRRVLLRGLSVDPDRRWPSMAALLQALANDPARARRRRLLTVGALAVVALGAAAALRGAKKSELLCRGGPARLAPAWATPGMNEKRSAIERAFRASGAAGAEELWQRVAAQLDQYAASWLAAHRDACEATHVRGVQQPAVLDVRMGCLDERRNALAALTDVLRTADRGVVAHAVDAVNALPAIDACSNAKRLSGAVDPPRDEETRQRVAELRRGFAEAKALTNTGRVPEGVEKARALLEAARATAYPPVILEALMGFAWSRGNSNFAAEMLPAAEESVWAGLAAGRDDLAAESAVMLASSTGYYLGQTEIGWAWARLAHALLDRLGDSHGLLAAWLLQGESLLKTRTNDVAGALDLVRRSVALKEKILGPDHPDVGLALNAESEVLHALGRDAEALEVNARALVIWERAYGRASLDGAAYLFSNRSEYLLGTRRFAEAEQTSRQALARWEAQMGPGSHLLGYPLTAMGRARLALGRPGEAVAPLARACRLREAGEPVATLVAESRFALAQALWDSGGDRREARTLATRAREAYATSAREKEHAAVDAWLAAHER